ncbi:MAG TPA: Wzz/FepE/Etk N-terminal domain-containing protein [bacterium]
MNKKTIQMNDHEIDLFDYANVLIQHRKMIIRNVVVTAIAVVIISFLLPRSYTAVTTILPPEDKQTTNFLSALSNSPLSSLILNESGTTSDLYVEILKSRSVLDGVLSQEFSYPKTKKKQQKKTLLTILKAKSLEKGRKKIASKVDITASPEGIISVWVELKDRNLAADVANALVNELDKINKEKSTSRAKNSRVYIENQLKATEEKLKKASEDLVAFQEKYKAISLEDQTKIAIEKAGELKGRIVAKNVELGVSQQTMKLDNVTVVQLKREIEELEKQYNFLQYGDSLERGKQKEFYIPFADVPEVGLRLAKLMREVKVQETVWELLNQQYYHAKIQEARDTPTIQVLDEAVPPELRTKPKRKLLVLIGSFLAFMLSIFWAFIAEYVDRLKSNTETYHKTKQISEDLKKDWQKIKSNLNIFRTNRRNND